MLPYLPDPSTYRKAIAFHEAVDLCRAFLTLNALSHPEYLGLPPPVRGRWKDRGLYVPAHGDEPARVYVDVVKSVVPVRNPGHSWSFPGNKADLTAVGVVAHETGHHVHQLLGYRQAWRAAAAMFPREPPVSGYEPHLGEAIAEALRLFVLNPELLHEGRPFRWAFVTDVLGLRPLHSLPWQQVLVHAHPRLIAACAGWILRRNPRKRAMLATIEDS